MGPVGSRCPESGPRGHLAVTCGWRQVGGGGGCGKGWASGGKRGGVREASKGSGCETHVESAAPSFLPATEGRSRREESGKAWFAVPVPMPSWHSEVSNALTKEVAVRRWLADGAGSWSGNTMRWKRY